MGTPLALGEVGTCGGGRVRSQRRRCSLFGPRVWRIVFPSGGGCQEGALESQKLQGPYDLAPCFRLLLMAALVFYRGLTRQYRSLSVVRVPYAKYRAVLRTAGVSGVDIGDRKRGDQDDSGRVLAEVFFALWTAGSRNNCPTFPAERMPRRPGPPRGPPRPPLKRVHVTMNTAGSYAWLRLRSAHNRQDRQVLIRIASAESSPFPL